MLSGIPSSFYRSRNSVPSEMYTPLYTALKFGLFQIYATNRSAGPSLLNLMLLLLSLRKVMSPVHIY